MNENWQLNFINYGSISMTTLGKKLINVKM